MPKELQLGVPLSGQYPHHYTTRPKVRIVALTQLFGQKFNDYYKQFGLEGHNGIDFRTKHFKDGHAPIYATHDGYVISDASIQSDTAGRYVRIMSDPVLIDGNLCKVETIYFHLSKCFVSVNEKGVKPWFKKLLGKSGTRVRRGMKIGLGGNTGKYTTGPHLHFGLRVFWKQKNGTYQLDANNGYGGCIDPMRFFRCNEYMRYGDDANAYFYVNGKKVPASTVTVDWNKK